MFMSLCFQHTDFVIVNKPAGVSVHRDDQAVSFCENLAKQLKVPQVWLVHRLDKVTSGLLILALKKEAAARFYQLFANHQIQKTYWALAVDKPKKKQGRIIGDMQKSRNGTWKLCHSKENPAVTQFLSRSVEPNLRHFILQPQTGKTHQLRVAMKSLGSPILGDKRYGGIAADRVYLHAYQLDFVYQGEQITVSALPECSSGQFWQKVCQSDRG